MIFFEGLTAKLKVEELDFELCVWLGLSAERNLILKSHALHEKCSRIKWVKGFFDGPNPIKPPDENKPLYSSILVSGFLSLLVLFISDTFAACNANIASDCDCKPENIKGCDAKGITVGAIANLFEDKFRVYPEKNVSGPQV
ncbi:hypothetical protein RhiirA5_379599 [Rhizophagus irregularis]|uniref:Uncharacterized protein n=1 Tax=Rhizophagus irregularis TaxID=588596 RepID=A0A2N0PBG2_9GLOM|nr:hypothetical protein RhiirA5_379599 [Rhizophagus irregularis]